MEDGSDPVVELAMTHVHRPRSCGFHTDILLLSLGCGGPASGDSDDTRPEHVDALLASAAPEGSMSAFLVDHAQDLLGDALVGLEVPTVTDPSR